MSTTLWTLSIIFLALLFVSIVIYIMKKKVPNKDFSEVSIRVKTWWGMFLVFGMATLFSEKVSLISLMILCFFALKEYFSMMKTRKADRRLFLWSYLAIPVQFYWIYIGWYGMFIVFIPVYVFLFMPLPRILGKGTTGFLHSVSSTQWGVMLMVFGLSHLAFFQIASPEYGANLVLFLVVLTQVNDVVHHFISLYFGKRKVVPSANANITWEGFVGGAIVTAILAYFIIPYLTPFSVMAGVLLGLLISISGFLGSLTISVLKRDLLIGNHEKLKQMKGSYLNRVDSLAYTSPVFLHVVRYFYEFM
ncbi:phosphatidate cytidylyltransferase [Metabacillus malikii]|uniref:Phosphatidate cytidylyltransferase n=1 Tax=Metabacillus malikii TaxID=1504265 RepID=A0ABT9ZM86_9BACI|nr:phosphatidate cytidylyltransferase [Metabacillus malikii]MDQ0232325.1 phosphatidate cytidylyltransferase [Metabacillus malikii]